MHLVSFNVLVYVFLWTFVLLYLGYTLGVELQGHASEIYLVLVDTAKQFSKVVVSVNTFTNYV